MIYFQEPYEHISDLKLCYCTILCGETQCYRLSISRLRISSVEDSPNLNPPTLYAYLKKNSSKMEKKAWTELTRGRLFLSFCPSFCTSVCQPLPGCLKDWHTGQYSQFWPYTLKPSMLRFLSLEFWWIQLVYVYMCQNVSFTTAIVIRENYNKFYLYITFQNNIVTKCFTTVTIKPESNEKWPQH